MEAKQLFTGTAITAMPAELSSLVFAQGRSKSEELRSKKMGADERRSPRANVILTATVEGSAGCRAQVRIANLSANGAMVIGKGVPSRESEIIFRCNGLDINGWVTWLDGDRAGIQFAEPIEPEALSRKDKGPPVMTVKDERKLDFRRPGFRGNQMSQEERQAVEDWIRSPPRPSRPNG